MLIVFYIRDANHLRELFIVSSSHYVYISEYIAVSLYAVQGLRGQTAYIRLVCDVSFASAEAIERRSGGDDGSLRFWLAKNPIIGWTHRDTTNNKLSHSPEKQLLNLYLY